MGKGYVFTKDYMLRLPRWVSEAVFSDPKLYKGTASGRKNG